MHSGRERGFTLIETLIAVAIILAVMVGVVGIIHRLTHAATVGAVQQHASVEAGRLVDELQADASSAMAIFVPANDVLGASNADGHEVDFYTRSQTGNAVFWAYDYKAGTTSLNGTIQKYTYTWGAPGSEKAVGSPILGMLGLKASTESASAISSPMLNGYTPVAHDLTVNYSGVIGGNHVAIVQIKAQSLKGVDTREVELMAGMLPSGEKLVTALWTPTPAPNPPVAAPNPMTFFAPKAPAQTLMITDGSSYYIGHINEAAYGATNTCNNVVSISPGPGSSTAVPLTNGGKQYFTVTPNGALMAAASCDVTFTDDFGSGVSVHIVVEYNPPVGHVQVPGYPVNMIPINTSGTLYLSQANWLSPNAFALTSNNCTGLTAPGSLTANGSVPVTGTVTAGGASGSCSVVYTGGWTQSVTIPLTLVRTQCSNQSVGTNLGNGYYSSGSLCQLLINGANTNYSYPSAIYVSGGSASPTSTSAIPITESNDTTAISLASACPAGSSISATTLPGGGSFSSSAGGNITVRSGANSGTCTITANDNHGQSHTITVVINPDPAPTPCPAGTIGSPPNCYNGSSGSNVTFEQHCSGPGDGTGGCTIVPNTFLTYSFTAAPTTAATALKVLVTDGAETDSPTPGWHYPGIAEAYLHTPAGTNIWLTSGSVYTYYSASASAGTYTVDFAAGGGDPSGCPTYGYNPATGGSMYSNCFSSWPVTGYIEQL